MTELEQELADRAQEAITCAENLLRLYSFEVGGYTADQVLSRWLASHSPEWVRLAIVEALYQGRYKSVSVEQILVFWRRRGAPLPHFNHEFDRMVCSKFPRAMPSRVGGIKLFKQAFPNLGERSSVQASRSETSPAGFDATLAALRQGRATRPEPAARSLMDSASTMPDSSAPGVSERDRSNRAMSARLPMDASLKRSLQLFPERQPSSSTALSSALQLPMFPTKRPPQSQPEDQPKGQSESLAERDRPPDNLVPLPVRPTAQSIPSSQVGSYDLRTESGRQEFMQTMLGMLSRQNSLSPQNTLQTEWMLWSDPQVLDVTAWTADSPVVEQEPSGTLRFLPSAPEATEPADVVWTQDVQTQDVPTQDIQTQDVQTAQTPDSSEVPQSVDDLRLSIPASSADSGMIHQFTPRTTSSPFYDKLKAVLPLSGVAGTDGMPDGPLISDGPPITDSDRANGAVARRSSRSLEPNQSNPLDTLEGPD